MASAVADRPYLGLTLGLAPEEELHPLVARERLHDAWVEFLGEPAGERPVVLLVEDTHWAEDDLCDLIDTPRCAGRWAAADPGHRPPRAARSASGVGWGMASYLGHGLGGSATHRRSSSWPIRWEPRSPHDRDLGVERAEATRFFVEELVGTLIDRGVLSRNNGRWAFGVAEGLRPRLDPGQLAARIHLLPEAEVSPPGAAHSSASRFGPGRFRVWFR